MPLEDQAQVLSLRCVTKPNSEAEAAPLERAHPTAVELLTALSAPLDVEALRFAFNLLRGG